MTPDGSSRSADAGRSSTRAWPLPESDIAVASDLLKEIHSMIDQIEHTISLARVQLAVLQAEAPALHQSLLGSETGSDVPGLADLQSARGVRAELVKVSQQSVLVSQSASRYLQARERFLIARRDWMERTRI